MASNAAFEVGELSVAQRFGMLTLLHKKLDKTDLQYYRPLTVTSILYKLYGLVLQDVGALEASTPGHDTREPARIHHGKRYDREYPEGHRRVRLC